MPVFGAPWSPRRTTGVYFAFTDRQEVNGSLRAKAAPLWPQKGVVGSCRITLSNPPGHKTHRMHLPSLRPRVPKNFKSESSSNFNTWADVNQHVADCLLITDTPITADNRRYSADTPPILHRYSADTPPILRRYSADTPPILRYSGPHIQQPSGKYQPSGRDTAESVLASSSLSNR